MLDVGRDGVPVIAAVDTFDLPNWQAGTNTPHIRHAVSIWATTTVQSTTFTYMIRAAPSGNPRSGNGNGQVTSSPSRNGGGDAGRGRRGVLLVGAGAMAPFRPRHFRAGIPAGPDAFRSNCIGSRQYQFARSVARIVIDGVRDLAAARVTTESPSNVAAPIR